MRRHGEIPAGPHRRDPAPGHRVGSRRARRLAPLVLTLAVAGLILVRGNTPLRRADVDDET